MTDRLPIDKLSTGGLPAGLLNHLAKAINTDIHTVELARVGGGSINDAFRIVINRVSSFFLKQNSADRYPSLFEKERQGLEYLANQHCIAVPSVLYYGVHDKSQWLLLEWTA